MNVSPSSPKVSLLPRNLRSSLPYNVGVGASPSRWSFANAPVACKTYENVDFLYRNPPANSAPSGVLKPPPPLPAKAIMRGEPLKHTHTPNLFPFDLQTLK